MLWKRLFKKKKEDAPKMQQKDYSLIDERDEMLLRRYCKDYEDTTNSTQKELIREEIAERLEKYSLDARPLFESLDRKREERGYPQMTKQKADELRMLCRRFVETPSIEMRMWYDNKLQEELKLHGLYSEGIIDSIYLEARAQQGLTEKENGLFLLNSAELKRMAQEKEENGERDWRDSYEEDDDNQRAQR